MLYLKTWEKTRAKTNNKSYRSFSICFAYILSHTTCRKIFPTALIPSAGLVPRQYARACPTVSTIALITPRYVRTDIAMMMTKIWAVAL
jgi:hypothetical protein